MRIATDAEYHAAVDEAIRLAGAPAGTRAAVRLSETVRAVEEYEARRGWIIADDLRLSTVIARYRQRAGLPP